MNGAENTQVLAQAVEKLCSDDFDYLHQSGVLENPPSRPQFTPTEQSTPDREESAQETGSEKNNPQESASEESAGDESIFDRSEEGEAKKGEKEEEGEAKKNEPLGGNSSGHQWPEVGTILEADYEGLHYEAEVISAPRYKSGKAVRILTGPATDAVERSMSGAMLKATEKQRKASDLGKKGASNGWKFWKVKKTPSSAVR